MQIGQSNVNHNLVKWNKSSALLTFVERPEQMPKGIGHKISFVLFKLISLLILDSLGTLKGITIKGLIYPHSRMQLKMR